MIDLNILKFFSYSHLPKKLAEHSKLFSDLAHVIADSEGDVSEKNVALRKLLEAKDASVRSLL